MRKLSISRSTGVVALSVVLVALAAGVSVAQPRQTSDGGIRVSDDVNFQGPTVTFSRDVPDLREFRFNDRISSVQVAPGESWEICENAFYGGRCVVVSGEERDLRRLGVNDLVTSMRRVPDRQGRADRADRSDRDARGRDDRGDRGDEGITVSDDVNFRGATRTIRNDVHDLRDLQFNDRISSVQVAPGESWEVCENADYGGRCVVISRSERDLRRLGVNDLITSMRRVRGREGRRE